MLKEKLLAVRSMNYEMARLEKERQIVAAKRDEAHKAFYMAQHQRTEMMLHFSRMQDEKDYERKVSEQVREQRREATFKLGKEVMMLSTKAADEENIDVPDSILDAESKLSKLTNELAWTQKKLMRAQAERENIQAAKML